MGGIDCAKTANDADAAHAKVRRRRARAARPRSGSIAAYERNESTVFMKPHHAEHARFHVIKKVAMEGPLPRCVGRNQETNFLARLHINCMFAY